MCFLSHFRVIRHFVCVFNGFSKVFPFFRGNYEHFLCVTHYETLGRSLSRPMSGSVEFCFGNGSFLLPYQGGAWRHRSYKYGCIALGVFISLLEDNTTETWSSGMKTFDKENRKMALNRQKMTRQHSDASLPPAQRRNLPLFVDEYQNTWERGIGNREGRRKHGHRAF